MCYSDFLVRHARLTILKELAEQTDETLNDAILVNVLDTYGFRRGRDFVRTQLRFLESELGAVTLVEAGTVVVATLARPGRDHVNRRSVLEGVARPNEV